MTRACLALLLLLASTGRALAQSDEPRPHELSIDRWVTGSIVAGGATLWLLSEVWYQREYAPASCRLICEYGDVNGFDTGARDAIKWDDVKLAHHLSDGTGFVGAPVVALGGLALAAYADDMTLGDWGDDVLVVGEATVTAVLINRVAVFSFGRTRPRIQLGGVEPGDSSDNLSFFSGHTTTAFAFVVSAGTVASMRGYRGAKWIWIAGLPMAAATGLLRMAADRHWATDVIVGTIVGSGVGAAIPLLFHRRQAGETPSGLSLGHLPGGGLLTFAGTF
jgi:membrane-associated phospholipid phosphatase